MINYVMSYYVHPVERILIENNQVTPLKVWLALIGWIYSFPYLAGQYILHHVSYENPSQPGFFGKVSAFAKAQSISKEKAQRQLQQKLIYTLHKPRRRRIPTLPPGCLV